MSFFLQILIAVSLSMDAFSLSLAYGTLGMSNRDKLLLSFITGIFHFFMPLMGLLAGKFVLNFISINPDIIVFVILSFIGTEMFISSFKETEVKKLKLADFFLFALAVSIDSFSVGITLTEVSKNIFFSLFSFAISSSSFTYLGLFLGNKIARLFGKLATIAGGSVLIVIGLTYFF